MVRTTVRLNADLLRAAKKLAAETGTTLTALIEDSLRKELAQSRRGKKRKPTVLPTFRGDGTWPGVNLDSNAALLDYMDGLSDPD